MDRRLILTLLLNDLRLLMRSGRTVLMSVVLPLLFFPVILLLSSMVAERQLERRESTVYRYSVEGGAADAARGWIDAGDERLAAAGERDFFFDEVPTEEPEAGLEAEELHFYLETDLPGGYADVPKVALHYRGDRDDSSAGGQRMLRELRRTRAERWEARLEEAGFPIAPAELFELEESDIASAAEASGLALGRFLTLFLVMMLLSGGAVVAMDSLAGEKERGTLETLLTTSASRAELVSAKSLAILVVGVIITVINLANLLVWIRFDLIPVPSGFAVPIDVPMAGLLLFLYLPVAALISSLLLVVSGYAKSYKEAQLLQFPLLIACAAPSVVSILPGLELRASLALLPLAGIALAVKEVLSGDYNWPLIALAWLSTTTAAVAVARRSVRALSNERLITASDFDVADFLGGPALFPRHVLRWFAALWAVFLLVQLNFGPPRTDLRIVLPLNMALFVVTALALIYRYRLGLREALALRLPPAMTWLALVLAVPSGAILTLGVGELSGLFFPAPEAWIEAMEKSLLPEELPLWQLLVLVAVLPGICEEVAFRGVLLHGLRRRLRPVALVCTVGVVFGLFHVDLFRILPTAFLGGVLAVVTLLSGSILPAVVWHGAHNATMVLASQRGEVEATGLPWWVYPPAILVFALALAILWRFRRPYPGLKSEGSPARKDGPAGDLARSGYGV